MLCLMATQTKADWERGHTTKNNIVLRTDTCHKLKLYQVSNKRIMWQKLNYMVLFKSKYYVLMNLKNTIENHFTLKMTR